MRIINSQTYQEKRDAISHDWLMFLKKLNYLPIFIPNSLENVDEFLDELKIDGIIISGGDNLGDDPIRDQTENKVIRYGIKNKMPMLGVCRGMQAINTFFGGKVCVNQAKNHVGIRHNIRISTNKMPDLDGVIEVNSFHNNIIEKHDIADDFELFALCEEDSTIEGIIHSKLPIIGVMWHPEREQTDSQLKLMGYFKKNES